MHLAELHGPAALMSALLHSWLAVVRAQRGVTEAGSLMLPRLALLGI